MRIYDVNLTGSSAAEAARAQEAQRTDRSSSSRSVGTNSSGGDSIEFSTSLGRLSQTMASYASSRLRRVDALAARFQSGAYSPDSAATSKGIVSEALATGVN